MCQFSNLVKPKQKNQEEFCGSKRYYYLCTLLSSEDMINELLGRGIAAIYASK
jgi:hypothetical protein